MLNNEYFTLLKPKKMNKMKKLTPIILLFIPFNLSAQQKNDYTSSSLHLH
jgi:hypothetical protein